MLTALAAIAWVLIAYIYGNALEWVIHKKVLHERGREKKSFFRFHWSHHALVRRHDGRDPDFEDHSVTKEFIGIILLAILHIPLVLLSPILYFAIAIHGIYYLYVHRKSHMDLDWAKKRVPWHWDHHMGSREAVNANWCVTSPFFDYIMHTRVKYYNTGEYYIDLARDSTRKLNEKNNGKLG